jgi:hypothetical protein
VGGGAEPGSISRLDEGGAGTDEVGGFAAIARYGIGEQDAQGVYDEYDLPEGHAALRTAQESRPVTWSEILACREVIVADFSSEYGIRLERLANHDLSWIEFAAHVMGLLAADTRLHRLLFQPSERGEEAAVDE